MSRRALVFALALSLLFNLGFLVGWMRPGMRAQPAGDAAPTTQKSAAADRERPLHDIRLSRDQRHRALRAVGDARAVAEAEIASAHAELAAREALRAALVAQPFDAARARAAATALADVQAQRTQRGQRALVETVAVLDEPQRKLVADRLASEDYRANRWKALRARFDRDHDGRLDDAERAAAAAASSEAQPGR